MERNDSSRREAERLAAAALAAASFAAKNLSRRMAAQARSDDRDRRSSAGAGGFGDELAALAGLASRFLGDNGPRRAPEPPPEPRHHIANGSDECCVCPVCRVIAAVRDPSPEFSERIASGASDLAAGVATVMRAFGNATRRGAREDDSFVDEAVRDEPVDEISEFSEDDIEIDVLDVDGLGTPLDSGDLADVSGDDEIVTIVGEEPEAEPESSSLWGDFSSVWQAATHASFDDAEESGRPAPAQPAPKKAVAKKTVAKKAVAKKPVAKEAVGKKAVAKKAVPKKAVAQPSVPPVATAVEPTRAAKPPMHDDLPVGTTAAKAPKKAAKKSTPATGARKAAKKSENGNPPGRS